MKFSKRALRKHSKLCRPRFGEFIFALSQQDTEYYWEYDNTCSLYCQLDGQIHRMPVRRPLKRPRKLSVFSVRVVHNMSNQGVSHVDDCDSLIEFRANGPVVHFTKNSIYNASAK